MNDTDFKTIFEGALEQSPELFEAIFFISELEVREVLLEEFGHLKFIDLPKYQTDSYPIDSKYHKSISRCSH